MIPLYDDNPRTTFPIVTVGLILVNILVFLWQQAVGPAMYMYTMIPSIVTHTGPGMLPISETQAIRITHPALHPAWLTIFSSMFMHGGFMHIAGNMLYLWIFGDNIEEDLGKVKYILFYLLVGLAAAIAQIMSNPASPIPTLGASGAIAGVMGGYILLHPRANVRCLVPIGFFSTLMSVPAYIVLGIWFLYQVLLNQLTSAGDSAGGGVAYMAHIGGFIAGLLLIKLFGGRSEPRPRYYEPYTDPWR